MKKKEMFSAFFKNIKELQIFLTYADPLAVTTIPDTLGFAFITWCAIMKGKENFIKSIDGKTKEERI